MSDAIAAPAAPAAIPAATPPTDLSNAPIADAAAPKAEPKAAPVSSKRKYNVKVDGVAEDVDFDPSNEAEVIKHLQMSKAAQKRMGESAELRKGVAELVQMLQTDPGKVLSDPRLNIPAETRRKLAEAIMNNELEEMNKSPEQKEKDKIMKEYEQLKKQVELEKQGREAAELRAATEQQAVALDTEISSAIEKSGLPKNARTVRYFAEGLMFALQNNIQITAEDLIPTIKKQALSEFKELISLMPDEEFEGFLGKDQISRIRKRSIAKAKAAANPTTDIKSTGAEVKPSASDEKKVNMKDFMKSLGRF
jgi:hypothetical protein